jgi:segregation and condensation protein B
MSDIAKRRDDGVETVRDAGPGPDAVTDSSPENAAASAGDAAAGELALRELKAILEAVLFVSHEPVSLDRMKLVAEGAARQEILEAVRSLQQDYALEGRGLQLVELAGGYQIVTKPAYAPWLKRLEKAKQAPRLSRSALESLAIIAYKQPIVRAEIEQIRGVETSGVLRTLLERKLVRIVGRRDEPGRPILYGTTKYFLQHFGLRDLSELPPLHEFKELGEPQQADLPMGEGLEVNGLSEGADERSDSLGTSGLDEGGLAGEGDMLSCLTSGQAEPA